MEKYLRKHLRKHNLPFTTDSYGNIYVTKGDAENYPTIVSHIDTVHAINHNSIVKRHKNVLYSIDTTTFERTGIGGDDKVGVYICLSMLHNLPACKAVFFKDEEVGCVGSSHADMDFFHDSSIVLQCDRKGMGDFVTNISGVKLCDDGLLQDIEDILDMYNRKACTGGLTDVKSIATATEVQVANVNCGYYNPHTDDEVVCIDDVYDTEKFVYEVLERTAHTQYRMARDYPSYDWYDDYNRSYYGYNTKKKTTPYEITKLDTCPYCNTDSVVHDDYSNAHYCYTCDEYIIDYELAK